jgi:hypothetical protein
MEVFTRALGLIACLHFLSVARQIIPLVGAKGLEPAHLLFRAVKRDLNPLLRVLRFPSVFLFYCSDNFIRFVCFAGFVASLAIVFGYLNPILFLVAWICWLSIQTANTTLFSFPWDQLLSECLFFAAFLPRPAVIFYFNWLLFRVMFGMGLTRFRKIGETERDLTYIYHFYQWQPFPTPLAVYMRTLPMWFHKLSFVFLFFAEIVVVFGIFGTLQMRIAAAVFIALLQFGIWATGNYGTFNVLTLALCLTLLQPLMPMRDVVTSPFIIPIVLSFPTFLIANFWTGSWWVFQRKMLRESKLGLVLLPFAFVLRFLAPFRLLNSYGVFLHQEVYVRDRIVPCIQGTADGKTWLNYEPKFLYDSPKQRPKFFAPYHPRLDHYLFYGLGEPDSIKLFMFMACNPYYYHPFCLTEKLVQKLLRNDDVAVRLFANNPFPEKPPLQIRFAVYKFNFTKPEELLGVSEPVECVTVSDDTGIRPAYDRFVSETLGRIDGKDRAVADPGGGKPVAIHLHPVRRAQ